MNSNPSNCPLLHSLHMAFLTLTCDGYNLLDAFKYLCNSRYNTCFVDNNVPLMWISPYKIINELRPHLAKEREYVNLYYVIYAYAYVCYKYKLTLSDLNDLIPVVDVHNTFSPNKHCPDASCARYVDKLYNDMSKVKQVS